MVYKMVSVWFPGSVWLEATDPQEIETVLEELRVYFKSAKVGGARYSLDGGLANRRLEKLGGKDEEVYYWLLSRFCKLGWEPFANVPPGSTREEGVRFRKKV